MTHRARAPGAEEISDFVQLSGPGVWGPGLWGPGLWGADFECSSTVAGVSGSLCVTPSALMLGRSDSGGASAATTARVGTDDIRSWRVTLCGATFSLAIEAKARHSVVLLAQFHAATVQAMTRAVGPAAGVSA